MKLDYYKPKIVLTIDLLNNNYVRVFLKNVVIRRSYQYEILELTKPQGPYYYI